jgi:hypothetical protein
MAKARPMMHRCAPEGLEAPPNCYLAQMPELSALARYLPGGRRGLMDIDGLYEFGIRFVFIEWKKVTGQDKGPVILGEAQRLALRNLTLLDRRVRVLIGRGYPGMRAVWFQEIHDGVFSPGLFCEPDDFFLRFQHIAERYEQAREPEPFPYPRVLTDQERASVLAL